MPALTLRELARLHKQPPQPPTDLKLEALEEMAKVRLTWVKSVTPDVSEQRLVYLVGGVRRDELVLPAATEEYDLQLGEGDILHVDLVAVRNGVSSTPASVEYTVPVVSPAPQPEPAPEPAPAPPVPPEPPTALAATLVPDEPAPAPQPEPVPTPAPVVEPVVPPPAPAPEPVVEPAPEVVPAPSPESPVNPVAPATEAPVVAPTEEIPTI